MRCCKMWYVGMQDTRQIQASDPKPFSSRTQIRVPIVLKLAKTDECCQEEGDPRRIRASSGRNDSSKASQQGRKAALKALGWTIR